MRKLIIGAVMALVVIVTACIIQTDSDDATLLIRNRSDFVVEEINLAPIDSPTWGPNLLDGDVLFPDEDIEIFGIECDLYDVRIIDELDAVCIIEAVDLCGTDAIFTVTNSLLEACEGFIIPAAAADITSAAALGALPDLQGHRTHLDSPAAAGGNEPTPHR